MNKRALKNTAKWIWIVAVIGFAIAYTIVRRDLVFKTFSMLSAKTIMSAAAMILVAKLCLVVNMRAAAIKFKIMFGWWDCYCIYNLTQLAKYVPGSIWQFVGRITILHERGTEPQAIRDSLIAEHSWVVASAFVLSSVLVFNRMQTFMQNLIDDANAGAIVPWIGFGAFALISILLLFILVNKRLSHWAWSLAPPLYNLPFLLLTWILLGAAFWVTLSPFVLSPPSIFYVSGIYCFAFLSGFLVPFSPAGLGIREVVLTFCLTPFIQADIAILLAAINRIIYFIVEVFAVSICLTQNVLKKSAL